MVELSDVKEGEAFDAPVDMIDNTGGLRPVDPEWAAALGHMMQVRGQRTPVEVHWAGGRLKTVSGRHRVEGRRLTEQLFVRAILVGGNELDLREAEITENLFRRDLAPLDRAAFVADLIDVQKARRGVARDVSPQSVAATARWADRLKAETEDATDTMSDAFGWTDAVAEAVGLTARTIRRDLELFRGLSPAVVDAIRHKPVAGNASQLRKLALLGPADQQLVTGMIAEDTAKGVTDALATLKQAPVKSPAQKAWAALISNWGRLAGRERKEALRHFAEAGLPKGVTIIVDGVTFGGAK